MEWNIAGCYSRFQPYCNREQLYTVPVKLRSCRRLDEIGLAFCSPSRFHPKENCIFLALLRSYPFAALAQERSAPRSVPGQRAQLNTIPDRSSRAILTAVFLFGGDAYQRSKGQSAVAGAAYQSGEKLFSEYDQRTKNYSGKRGILYTEIMLPSHAPPEYANRETLWNSVENAEKQWNAQLARRFVLALPKEVPPEQYPQMIRDYCEKQFVSKGMIADFAIHDPAPPGHNVHCHVMLTLRAMDEQGKWLPKSRKVYDLDENGERIRLPSGNWKSHKEDTVDWNDQKYAEIWRQGWADTVNRYLEAVGRPERLDLRSYERQGLDVIPTVHMGPAVVQMERRGIQTNIGNLNRDIKAANQMLSAIRKTIRGLLDWIEELIQSEKEFLKEEISERRSRRHRPWGAPQ